MTQPLCVFLMQLFDHVQFFTDFDECGNGAVKLFAGVGCGQLDADTCLAFGYYRVVETGHVDVFVSLARKYSAFSITLSRSSVLALSMSKTAMEAPQMAGDKELENR